MAVYKSKSKTSDGRIWFFKTNYIAPATKKSRVFVSKKYFSQEEAMEAEHEFILKIFECKNVDYNMTFSELYNHFLEFKKGEVRPTTFKTYGNSIKYFKSFMNTKCVDFNLPQYEKWKNEIKKSSICTRYKNDLLKFWKNLLNYGAKYHNFDFSKVYRRMTNFTNPNEKKKEMKFYTLEEFKKFIAEEDDFRFRCLWETLFFCGLRSGEASGLMWNCVDFDKRTIAIKQQALKSPAGSDKPYILVEPKTKTSNRKVPMSEALYNDLSKLKADLMSSGKYKDDYFVFGYDDGTIPFRKSSVRDRVRRLSSQAGLKYIRLHDFRHSCASLLINSGANVTMVAKYLGHSQIEETLNTYSHLFPSALDNVISIINNLEKKNDNS